MATKSESLKTAVKAEVKEAETEAKTGDVKTVRQTSIGDWREQQAGKDLATGKRRSHPPT